MWILIYLAIMFSTIPNKIGVALMTHYIKGIIYPAEIITWYYDYTNPFFSLVYLILKQLYMSFKIRYSLYMHYKKS